MSDTVNDQTLTATAPLYQHYIFQYTKTQHRRIGPFSNKDDALQWVNDHVTKSYTPRWVLEELTLAEVSAVPIFNDWASRAFYDAEQEQTDDLALYEFVMTFDGRLPVFYGAFKNLSTAFVWGCGWQWGNGDCPCWEIRYLSKASLSKPIEIINPDTIHIPLLTE